MALFKSQVLTQASGSVGGLTYSHNRGGMYMRARTVPTNPNTPAQQLVRQILADLTNTWQSVLSQAQRDAWNVYASMVTMFNRLGDEITLSGQQHYVRSNAPRALANSTGVDGVWTRVDDAPTTFNLGSFTPVSIASSAPTAIGVTFTEADDWVAITSGETGMLVFTSRPLNSGVSFFRGPYRFAGAVTGDGTLAPTSPFVVTSPFTLTGNQQVAARVVVSRADGRLSMTQFVGPLVVVP